MLRLLLSAVVLTTAVVTAEKQIGIVFGGDGGGVEGKVILKTRSCKGSESAPNIPVASYENQNGWVAGHIKLDGFDDIILCGGMALTETDECHMMQLPSSEVQSVWRKGTCKLPTTMTHASMVSYDNSVIISGGYSSQIGWLKDVYQLTSIGACDESNDDDCCTWETLPEMPGQAVYSHCSLMYDDNLVIMGGNAFDMNSYGMYDVDEMKILNLNTGEWTQSTIPSPRQRFGCVRTTHNGKEGIMISGGFCHGYTPDSCDQLRLEDTHFFDWESKSWEDIGKPMYYGARDGHTILNVQDHILLFGGDRRGLQVEEVEEWNGEKWVPTGFDLAGFGVNNYAVTTVPEFTFLCVND